MLRRLLALGATAAVACLAADRALALARGGRAPEPIRTLAVMDAPIGTVWAAVADVAFQTEWMAEMRELRLEPPGRAQVGQRGEATVRILGVSVRDRVEITDLDPPRRYAIRHLGPFKGDGVIALESGADGSTTVVRWEETLAPPLLPELGALLARPVLRAVFQADLDRLGRLVQEAAGA